VLPELCNVILSISLYELVVFCLDPSLLNMTLTRALLQALSLELLSFHNEMFLVSMRPVNRLTFLLRRRDPPPSAPLSSWPFPCPPPKSFNSSFFASEGIGQDFLHVLSFLFLLGALFNALLLRCRCFPAFHSLPSHTPNDSLFFLWRGPLSPLFPLPDQALSLHPPPFFPPL